MAGRDRAARRGHGRSRGRTGRLSTEGARPAAGLGTGRDRCLHGRLRVDSPRRACGESCGGVIERDRSQGCATRRRRRRTAYRCRTSRQRRGSTARCTRPTRTSGYANRKLGRYDESLSAYDQALKINPDTPHAIEYQGEAFLALNRVDEARFNFLRLYALDQQQRCEAAAGDAGVGGGEQGEAASGRRCACAGGVDRGARREFEGGDEARAG